MKYTNNDYKRGVMVIVSVLLIGLYVGTTLTDLVPRDTTDSATERSGMTIYVDHFTNCQYLGTHRGGLTPRLDEESRHICDEKTEFDRLGV